MLNRIVYIKDVKYRGRKKKINWKNVEEELKKYIGKSMIVDEYNKEVFVGKDFPDEFIGSKYTARLKGSLIKVKANMASIILELVKNAADRKVVKNYNEKHNRDAKYGWEKYNVRFAMPIYDDKGKFNYYNDYITTMLVRLDENGKSYIYDFINIKKRKEHPA